MYRKNQLNLVCVFVLGLLLLFAAACAKKQVAVSDTAGAPAVTTAADDEAARAREAERARMLELEKAERAAQQIQAFENEMIYFDFDRSDLRPEAKIVLQKKAEWLRANPEFRLTVEGHCDERGTAEYNLALGERRAVSAKTYLAALGVSAQRITTISYGEERPLDPRQNEEAYARNRRAEFRLNK